MKRFLLILFALTFLNCHGQSDQQNDLSNKIVGGGCEGCELMYVGMPEQILSEHTSIGWTEGNQKLIVTGKVFQLDGRIPAPNVVIYYWHTDDKGLYSTNEQTPAKAIEHGKLRGWVKSDKDLSLIHI